MKEITFVDLFCGIGGFRNGLETCNRIYQKELNRNGKNLPSLNSFDGRKPRKCSHAGVQVGLSRNGCSRPQDGGSSEGIQPEKQKPATETPSFTCVYSNEWDKYANSVYRKHYGECDTRDIRTVPESEIPDFDLLCAGFPCQSFSVAGKRKGFEDTRGTLFFEIARILKYKRPRYLLLENVKGLLSSDSGKTFQTILGVLAELGYGVEWQVLNSKNFGIPQNRERVFIIGHLGGIGSRQVFPIEGDDQKTNPELEYIGGIISNRDLWLKDGKQNSRNFSQGQRVYGTKGIASTLAGNAGGLGGKTGLYVIPVLTPDRVEKRQNGRRFKTDGEPSLTLTGQDVHGVAVYDDYNHRFRKDGNVGTVRPTFANEAEENGNKLVEGLRIRRLTPTETMRLQGFLDHWCDYGADGEIISDSQKYRMAGNAVSVPVITAIGIKLLKLYK